MTDDEWMDEQQRLANLATFRRQVDPPRSPMEIALSILDAKPHLVDVWLHRKARPPRELVNVSGSTVDLPSSAVAQDPVLKGE